MSDAAVQAAEVKGEAAAVKLPSLTTRVEWYEDWEEQTRDNRKEQSLDCDYHHNKQWTREEVADLNERRQPVLTKNRIARKINSIIGDEIEKRVDPCARPRNPQQDADGARAMTDMLRFIEEQQEFDYCRSSVFKDILVPGIGGSIKEVYEDEGEVKDRLRHIEWNNLAYDPHSRAADFGDARWLAFVAWMDLDDAIEEFPDAKEELKKVATKGDSTAGDDTTTSDIPKGWIDQKRKRIKLVEMYLRDGRDWNASDCYKCVFTDNVDIVPPVKTEFLNEKRTRSVRPLSMMSAYVDGDGMRYGLVRQLRSPQDEINKRSSKALHLLSVNNTTSEDGAIPDPDKFAEERAKPDGNAIVAPGALSNPNGPAFIEHNNMELAQGQLQLLQEAKNDIDSIGPSAATIPELPNSSSGRAFLARQKAALKELGEVFDNLRRWSISVFHLDWLSARLWKTEEQWLRVTDDQELDGYRFTAINQKMTRAQRLQELMKKVPPPPPAKAVAIAAGNLAPVVMAQAQQIQQQRGQQVQAQLQQAQQLAQAGQLPPEQLQRMQAQAEQMNSPEAAIEIIASLPIMQEQITVNQVDQMLVDIVIEDVPETSILADEQFDTMATLLPVVAQGRPDLAPTWIKLMIQASTLPDKRELLKELDKGPDPQQMKLQQQNQQLQMALQQATIAVEQTKAQLQQAQTEKTTVETQLLPAKTQAEVESKQAQSISHAANAGARTGAFNGSNPPSSL